MQESDPQEPQESYLEAIHAGHVFFYDSETDEVVHMRPEIFEAAQEDSQGMDLELTAEEQADAEDAWEILEDQESRYLQMPPLSMETKDAWEKEFKLTGRTDWENFLAERLNEALIEWLDSVRIEQD